MATSNTYEYLARTYKCLPSLEKTEYRRFYNQFLIGTSYIRYDAERDRFHNALGEAFGELRFQVWLYNMGMAVGTEIINNNQVQVIYTYSYSLILYYSCVQAGDCPNSVQKCKYLTFFS